MLKLLKEEVEKLRVSINSINTFLENAPEGYLKWQNKNGKTYYFHEYENYNIKEVNVKGLKRDYIKRGNHELAKLLAKKQYYKTIKGLMEKRMLHMEKFINIYQTTYIKENEIYENMAEERKKLIEPYNINVYEKVKAWKEELYEQTDMFNENLKFETEQGEKVRSKSEVIIANLLYKYCDDLLYKYERPLMLNVSGKKKTIYPDFSILNLNTGKIVYWEHAGRMDDIYYACDFVKKMNAYITNELVIGRDVILTFETQTTPLDIGVVKRMIELIILDE